MLSFLNFSGAFGVAGILMASVLGAKNAKDRLTLQSYKEANRAYEELIKARDLQHQSDITQHDTNVQRIKGLEQTVRVLDDRVTQAPSITELAVQLATQHKEMMELQNRAIKQSNKMANELGNIAKAISKEGFNAS